MSDLTNLPNIVAALDAEAKRQREHAFVTIVVWPRGFWPHEWEVCMHCLNDSPRFGANRIEDAIEAAWNYLGRDFEAEALATIGLRRKSADTLEIIQ